MKSTKMLKVVSTRFYSVSDVIFASTEPGLRTVLRLAEVKKKTA